MMTFYILFGKNDIHHGLECINIGPPRESAAVSQSPPPMMIIDIHGLDHTGKLPTLIFLSGD